MPYIQMKADGKYKAKSYKKGEVIEVSSSLADLYVLNGKGTTSSKEAFEAQKKEPNELEKIFNLTDEEVKTFDYSKLKKKPLEAFAVRIGVDVEIAEKAKNMDDLRALVLEKLEA